MGEFVFPEILERFGHWENGGVEMKRKERKGKDEKADKNKSENKTIFGRMSDKKASSELFIAQVGGHKFIATRKLEGTPQKKAAIFIVQVVKIVLIS